MSLIGGNYMKSPKNIICKALKGWNGKDLKFCNLRFIFANMV